MLPAQYLSQSPLHFPVPPLPGHVLVFVGVAVAVVQFCGCHLVPHGSEGGGVKPHPFCVAISPAPEAVAHVLDGLQAGRVAVKTRLQRRTRVLAEGERDSVRVGRVVKVAYERVALSAQCDVGRIARTFGDVRKAAQVH
jgi:hypothetical protein